MTLVVFADVDSVRVRIDVITRS